MSREQLVLVLDFLIFNFFCPFAFIKSNHIICLNKIIYMSIFSLHLFTFDLVQENGILYELVVIHMVLNLLKHKKLLHMLKKSCISLEIKETIC